MDQGGRNLVQVWDVRGPSFVTEDWRTDERFPAELREGKHKTNTLEKMLFNVALFTPFATECAAFFNERLSAHGKKDWDRRTTPGEVLRSWGYYVGLGLNPSVPVEEAHSKMDTLLFPALRMGRHGMSKNRLKKMRELQALMYSTDEAELDPNDPWRYCRPPVRAFNRRRCTLIIPSWMLTLDESMSAWTGDEGVTPGVGSNSRPIPWLSFVVRKPEPLGAELKVVADGNVGCFLGVEIQEGAEAHRLQEWFDEYGHTTATSLRLLKPWFKGPRRPEEPWYKGPDQRLRACYGDSWFMGVNALEAFFVESGKVIYGLGDVKTNTSRLPVAELRSACGPDSGDWATFTSSLHLEDDTHMNVMALAHRRGGEVHTYLSTCGLSIRGKPQKHKDDDLETDTGHVIARKCPAVLNDATLAQPKIDRGNRRRQYDLALEKRFRTEAFPFRLFTTMLGICITDCFYLDAYFNKTKHEFRDACERMAWALMHNNIDQIESGECRPDDLFRKPEPSDTSPGSSTCTPCADDELPACRHIPVPLHCIPGYDGATQQKCVVCVFNKETKNLKTSYACVACSTKDYLVALHPVCSKVGKRTLWRCAIAHRRNPTAHGGIRPRSKKRKKQEGEGEGEGEEGEEGDGEEGEGEDGEDYEQGWDEDDGGWANGENGDEGDAAEGDAVDEGDAANEVRRPTRRTRHSPA